ncbi:hypothetical protein F511_16510 [Dorcoceras hygrometricum]|uniref:Uncharacterized protein n=1 Tax=Dorcoceras hygrometricum TaxID=472368 RepID=A0A2Z7CVU9_9LAMI|nr:hypothetical protein F511_16510 [Dorcoceras hygrometricum]
MVKNPNCQSQGFAVQVSVLLERLVKAYLGESVKLHPQKVSNNKSIHTNIMKNLNVVPAGDTSKVSGAAASEKQSTADEPQALPKEPEKEAMEKPMKYKERVGPMGKKQQVVVQQPMEARSQDAPAKSTSETSSYVDLHPLAGLKKLCGAKRKQVVESSDSKAIVSVVRPRAHIRVKPRKHKQKLLKSG